MPPKRNLQIFSNYARRPEFINVWRFVRGDHLMYLDWLWEISKREIPFSVDALRKAPGTFLITVTDLETGNPVYLPGNQGDIFSTTFR